MTFAKFNSLNAQNLVISLNNAAVTQFFDDFRPKTQLTFSQVIYFV